MNIRNVLESHKILKEKIKFTLKEIKQTRELAENVIDSGNAEAVVDKVLKIDDSLNKQYSEYLQLQENISRIIDSLNNEQELIVLKCYYILHYTADQIAAETGYCTRHIRRLLKSGLEKLQEKYNDVDIDDIEREDQNGNTERF